MNAIQRSQALRPFLPELERRGYRPQMMQDGSVLITAANETQSLATPRAAIDLLDAPTAALAWIVEFIDSHTEWASEEFASGTAEGEWLENARDVVRSATRGN